MVWIFAASAKKTHLHDNFPDVEARFLDSGRTKRGEWPRFYAYTPSGYTNSGLHAEIVGVFSKMWHDEHKNVHCWLFSDQLGAHKCADAVADALGRGVMCWLFPANTSHFLQPLDDLVFANFKQHLKESMRAVQWSAALTPFHFECFLYQLTYEAEKKALKKNVIKSAFFSTGIFPFDNAKILARTAAYAGKLKSESRFEFLSAMRSTVDNILQARAFSATLVTSKVTVEKNVLYLPFQLLEKGAEIREQRRLEAESKVAARREIQEAKEAKKLAKTCVSEGCRRYSNSDGRAAGWKKCVVCDALFCKQHYNEFFKHIEICEDTDLERTEVAVY
jgi:hypothetical protein